MSKYHVYFVRENCVVEVCEGVSLLDAQIQAGIYSDAPCGGNGTCGKCAVDVRKNADDLWVTRLACHEIVCSDIEVRTRCAASDMQILMENRTGKTQLWDPWVQQTKISDEKWKIDICGQKPIFSENEIDPYMAAFDIGTTTIAGYLISVREQATIAGVSMLNPQIRYGADVISRANYALEHALADLTSCIRRAIDDLLGELCAKANIQREQIFAVSIVGNTCMHHIFLGIELNTLVRAPYHPAVRNAMVLSAAKYGLKTHPCAQLLMLPVIAGFVGADTVACMLSENWWMREKCTLLIDIGTNGEMVLGNAQRRIACSTAAGPALEGAKIECGMRGEVGAIDHVWLDNGKLSWHTIGNGAPRGICGSGLVDLLAVMLECREMDESGKLQNGQNFRIGDTGVILTQKDVREVQLAKAAIAAGIRLMCKKMGVALCEIEEVCIAGAFGSYMNANSACCIGLLPIELQSKIQICGNAAGQGAQRVLMDRSAWKRAISLAEDTGFLELASMPEFQDVFVDELEFPEADVCEIMKD